MTDPTEGSDRRTDQVAVESQPSENPASDSSASENPASADDPIKSHDQTTRIEGGGLVYFCESGWQIQVADLRVELPPDADAHTAAQSFAALCNRVGGAERRCVIALASEECFFANIERPDSIDAKDRGAILFELERHFPLDAEAMVAEYSLDPRTDRVAAVAIESDRQLDLIAALEAVGIEVVSIIPRAFLIARAVTQWKVARWKSDRDSFRLLLVDQDASDWMIVGDEGVSGWRQFFSVDDEAGRHVTVMPDDDLPTLIIVGRRELAFQPSGDVKRCDLSASELAAQGASLVLRSRWGRWPDLRQGKLAPDDPLFAVAGSLRRLAIAVACCFAVLIVAASYRTTKLAEESESIRRDQRSAFAEAYPDRRVPILLMRTVRNEHRQTLGSRGRGDAIKLPTPATTVLRDLYDGLDQARRKDQAKFRMLDLDIADGECLLTVRAVDSATIGKIARSLETVGFEVAPPASEQIDPSKDEPIITYQSTISAIWSPPSESESAGSPEGGTP